MKFNRKLSKQPSSSYSHFALSYNISLKRDKHFLKFQFEEVTFGEMGYTVG